MRVLHAAAAVLFTSLATVAQCEPQWTGDPLPWIDGTVRAMVTWDPDGAGPAPARLVVGGGFVVGAGVERIATWDGSQWQPLPAPTSGVEALAVWNGQLVAASDDTVAVWNGTAWQVLGILTNAPGSGVREVMALAVYNNRLFVGGAFGGVGAVTAANLASFDGVNWSPVGVGVSGSVHAMASFDGNLYVGGFFSVSGITTSNLVAWNGTSFVQTPGTNSVVESMAVQPGLFDAGQLFVGGSFSTLGSLPAARIARFSALSASWSAVGGGLPGSGCVALCANGSLLTGTDVVAAVRHPGNQQKAWRWNGTAWSAMGTVVDTRGDVVPASAAFHNATPMLGLVGAARAMRTFVSGAWSTLRQPGIPDVVYAVDGNGADLLIGGSFTTVGNVVVNGIARGTHGAWQALGTGVNPGGAVMAIARQADGSVIAGGSFSQAGGAPAANIARWNGVNWSPLGVGTNGLVLALRVLADGSIVAAGAFTTAGGVAANRIARWNGTSWQPLGAGLSSSCLALAELPNGDLVAGGAFTTAGGVAANRIARWNGSTWQPLGSGVDGGVYSLAVRTDGTLAVGGAFSNAGGAAAPYIAIWNGATWAPLLGALVFPRSTVTALAALPDGSLVAGGSLWSYQGTWPFPSWSSALLRYEPAQASWSSLAVDGVAVHAAAVAPDGDVAVVGEFAGAGGVPVANVASLQPTCPASAVAYGAGCTGSGGPNVLTATQLPLLGGQFRAVGTGMPALGFVVSATGLTPASLPIASLVPQGLPGCTSLLLPDAVEITFASAGRVTTSIAIPRALSLVGLPIRQQVAPFETGAGGAVTAITATNGLLVTVGAL
jgi:hypothetical protein